MLTAVLSLEGFSSVTGAAEEVAEMLAKYVCDDEKFLTRNIQLKKWEQLFEEDMRSVLPATLCDVLSYIGYPSLKVRIYDTSLPQYV